MGVLEGPCTAWASTSDIVGADAEALASADDGVVAEALLAATGVLWAVTGRRWPGQCSERTVTFTFDHRTRVASARIELPDWPVTAVSSVTVDGVATVDGWRLVSGRWLERTVTGGDGRVLPVWWTGRDVAVTYTPGAEPPTGGVRACAVLAAQIALAAVGDGSCRLPDRVQTITRQNVSVAVLDPMDFLDKGLTGIAEVDGWVRAVNPSALTCRPRVWTPETAGPDHWEVAS